MIKILRKMKHNPNLIYIITVIATLGGLLFGYDTAVISGAEKSIQVFLIESQGLSLFLHGVTVSSALLGCIVGSAISGYLSLGIGRKPALIIAGVLFLLSALGSGNPEFLFFERGVPTMGLLWMFNFYRIIGGIGVGLASAVCPVYIGEIAPSEMRGKLVSLNQFAIIFGMLVVYFVNWGIAEGQNIEWINTIGWRRMFVSEAIPAAIFTILMYFMPESPRYLALKSKDTKALSILTLINGENKAKEIINEIKSTVETTKSKLYSYGKKVIVIGVLLTVFQQCVGINVVLYYAPRIFESMGVAKDASMLQTIIMGLVNVVFTIVAILNVDKWGRKPLLIVGSIGMAIGMIAISFLAFLDIIGVSTLIFIVVFTASFMMSWGPVCWVLISEIFPNRIRGKGVALAVSGIWISNFLISSTYPPMMEFSSAGTYLFYGVISIISGIFVWKFVPETKGKSLEEIEKFWKP
ncbi:D-xylose transporter XylE [Aestuariivivens sp. NBU2969]|uniref:D-xylose transporter XylE n=1 Tax=Aestuariivivens sp. NBU2969 TaxID=2873267 RepID=UPI001CBE510B|nr:D-xylose transporter XylE [Aestuariivivens sp. NBU2969]